MTPQVFFVTGSSTGFGNELVKRVLDEGDAVIATARQSSKLQFHNANKNNYLAVDCDVTDEASIENAFSKGLAHFGRIDVVVNNAGYGLVGAFESLTDAQIRHEFEVNFFGLVNVTRKALQVMRDLNKEPQGGRILQISSIAGHVGLPMTSMYCASKWAVEGFTESVRNEILDEWNIHFTLIEPGSFQTDWLGRSIVMADEHPAYPHLPARQVWADMRGKEPGDTVKAAKAFWDIAKLEKPPLRILLGSDAVAFMQKKLKVYGEWVEEWGPFAKAMDRQKTDQKAGNPLDWKMI
ncbi:uncharacterized oxidoreductase -like [Lecanosticta acicola]|uniref:Uncharacterized oxidoreductase -like n=1 Tax=Lecanosticta acicola TaxID=111012 RepID=A0AAI9EB44_9PEZI|nr:uncharacterized oxidoreductase -like [Lecanosticta acicola]